MQRHAVLSQLPVSERMAIYSLNGLVMLSSYMFVFLGLFLLIFSFTSNGSFLRKCLFLEFVFLSHFFDLSVPVLLSLTAFGGERNVSISRSKSTW
jgi:hypothetical protein